ncbi:MAG: hypothetical protein N2Z76_00375 [Treponemataceae bacterium]|nr:hypothetical protein [Treponemataceae bacterium]
MNNIPLDRQGLVQRHIPTVRRYDPWGPLTIGNGEFAFTADITGLQTFLPSPGKGIPLCTMAQWGWHSYPDVKSLNKQSLALQYFEVEGRLPFQEMLGKKRGPSEERYLSSVGYMTDPSGQEELFSWLRINPHRINLARLSFVVSQGPAGQWYPPPLEHIEEPKQYLDLWEGVLHSSFFIRGIPVEVHSAVAPDRDVLAFHLCSPALTEGFLGVQLSFPYPSHEEAASDWKNPEKHRTFLVRNIKGEGELWIFRRVVDATTYTVILRSAGGLVVESPEVQGTHTFIIKSSRPEIDFSLWFTPQDAFQEEPPLWEEVASRSARYWHLFWSEGGAVDFSDSTDPRAIELERRVILSQYLTAVNCAGSLPPQETGLTCNSWYGKFHLEMHYWHGAHFIQWGRPELFERSFLWYKRILPQAKDRAARQGYEGCRWPKMTEPAGSDAPSPIGPLLCWQQPHPIMYGELLSRQRGLFAVLKEYGQLFWETAEFMVSFLQWDEEKQNFCLGPPLIPAQECHHPREVKNPSFELEYWYWALTKACSWYEMAEQQKKEQIPLWGAGTYHPHWWREAAARLALPPCGPGPDSGNLVYLAHERCPHTFSLFSKDHPSMVLALGMLPGSRIDPPVMSATLEAVLRTWDFASCWGWDFPALAMTAARLGRSQEAVDLLLMESPKNTYLPNGHNIQLEGAIGEKTSFTKPDTGENILWQGKLPVYLPGNGALLLAVGMMVAGWDGAPSQEAPGFPQDGSWRPRWEGLISIP